MWGAGRRPAGGDAQGSGEEAGGKRRGSHSASLAVAATKAQAGGDQISAGRARLSLSQSPAHSPCSLSSWLCMRLHCAHFTGKETEELKGKMGLAESDLI